MDIRVLSPLEKVFFDGRRLPDTADYSPSGLLGETISFQVAYHKPDAGERYNTYCTLEFDSDIRENIRIRRVVDVPVHMPVYADADDDYITKQPGLYPDMLVDLDDCRLRALPGYWTSLWFDIEGAPAGSHEIDITIRMADGESVSTHVCVNVIDAALPEQKLLYTRWLHCDCIAQYYNVEVFSEDFWRYLEKFIAVAAKRGVNTMLVPIHTPPLDTAEGGERLTVQLVDISLENGKYNFGFYKLQRFIEICKRSGIKKYELAHLFTQWGAKHAPKIIANVDGKDTRLFGWETDATSPEYVEFLSQYLTALKQYFAGQNLLDDTIWHISDEPSFDHLESYRAARNAVMPYIGDQYILDALSDVRLYKGGAVTHPVPANNHVHDFIDAEVPGLWTYYCCGQYKLVSNQFIAMPSYRERILGVQMYKYDIVGFLHWGYNFYNSQYSVYPLDPFGNTDGDGFVPAGDTHQVYPGPDGEPFESIRIMVFKQCIDDMRALQLLESLTSREHVLSLIHDISGMDITFDNYPRNAEFIIKLRAAVDAEIADCTKGA